MVLNKAGVIDLFCGCGGLSQGFKDAGFDVLFGLDHDTASLKTFAHNFGQTRSLKADLFSDEYLEIIEGKLAELGGSADVIIAGPPCQGFSLTGPRNFDDPRNQLYLAVFKIVEKLKPKAFLIENVKGMKTLYGGEVLKEVTARFEKLGYRVAEPTILTAADYGVPQIRERLFIVGLRNDLNKDFDFPLPTHYPMDYVSCEDAISDLPSREHDLGTELDTYPIPPQSFYQKFMRTNAKHLHNHVGTRHTELVKSVIRQVPEGMNHKCLPPGVGESRKFNEAWTRYHSKRPSRTIDTGHRNHFHYKWDRVPTIRENARLQSFRDDFIFLGTKTQQNRQVGNAVPPLLAFSLAQHILLHIT